MKTPGQVVPAEELLEHVWDAHADPFTETVRVTVGTLRRKLALYRKHRIRPFIGGQFQEYVFATYGAKALRGFLTEAKPEHAAELGRCFASVPLVKVGTTVTEPRLRVAGANGEWLIWAQLSELKEAWQKPLRW